MGRGFLAVVCGLFFALPTFAADHTDSVSVTGGAEDIADLYAWMDPGGAKLNLVLTTMPFGDASARFSDAVQYAFHIQSGTAFQDTPEQTRIVIEFERDQFIKVWLGDRYLNGDASDTAGLGDDMFRVFAGPRNDPFFFNREGLTGAVDLYYQYVNTNTNPFVFDADGCPDVTVSRSNSLQGRLEDKDFGNSPGEDFFALANTLAIVIQVDVSLVNSGGDILAVWASTHAKGVAPEPKE